MSEMIYEEHVGIYGDTGSRFERTTPLIGIISHRVKMEHKSTM